MEADPRCCRQPLLLVSGTPQEAVANANEVLKRPQGFFAAARHTGVLLDTERIDELQHACLDFFPTDATEDAMPLPLCGNHHDVQRGSIPSAEPPWRASVTVRFLFLDHSPEGFASWLKASALPVLFNMPPGLGCGRARHCLAPGPGEFRPVWSTVPI
jgi:hypothetical protein